jgi:hypothetical protein
VDLEQFSLAFLFVLGGPTVPAESWQCHHDAADGETSSFQAVSGGSDCRARANRQFRYEHNHSDHGAIHENAVGICHSEKDGWYDLMIFASKAGENWDSLWSQGQQKLDLWSSDRLQSTEFHLAAEICKT